MTYIDMTPEQREAFIERQRKGWRSPDVLEARARDKINAADRAKRRHWRLKLGDVASEQRNTSFPDRPRRFAQGS